VRKIVIYPYFAVNAPGLCHSFSSLLPTHAQTLACVTCDHALIHRGSVQISCYLMCDMCRRGERYHGFRSPCGHWYSTHSDCSAHGSCVALRVRFESGGTVCVCKEQVGLSLSLCYGLLFRLRMDFLSCLTCMVGKEEQGRFQGYAASILPLYLYCCCSLLLFAYSVGGDVMLSEVLVYVNKADPCIAQPCAQLGTECVPYTVGRSCLCVRGYSTQSDGSCREIDDCAVTKSPCDEHAVCIKTGLISPSCAVACVRS
jgi:hypothetical protein